MNREMFARAIFDKMGWAASQPNLDAAVAWMSAENSQATWNPFDTEEGEPGATDYNSAGVKDYQSQEEGIQGFFDTITNGYYAAIINSFALQNPAATTAAAIDASPWGTKNVTQVLADVIANRGDYYTVEVGGSGAASTTPLPIDTTPLPDSTTPPPTVTSSFSWPLYTVAMEGAESQGVKAMQSSLRYVWGYVIAIDGFYGPVTAGAVKSFQSAHGLSQDGEAGPETLPVLYGLS